MELTFGQAQVYTSKKMKGNPFLAKLFQTFFGYTNLGNYARFTVFRKLVKTLPLKRNSKILDIGTGYGEYAISMSGAFPLGHIHALDINRNRINAVDEAIQKYGVDNVITHCDRIENLEEENFDFVFSIDVFEHIEPNEMPFKKAYEKLNKGGFFMVKMPTDIQRTILPSRYFEEHAEWLKDAHIGQIYDLDSLKARFEEEGFEIVCATYSDGWLARLGWEINYLAKKLSTLTHILSLPIAKTLVKLDRVFHRNSWGNAIQVIGKKK